MYVEYEFVCDYEAGVCGGTSDSELPRKLPLFSELSACPLQQKTYCLITS